MKLILDVQEDAKIRNFHIPKIAKDIGDMTNEQLLKMDDWSSELKKITQDFKKNQSHLVLEYAPTGKQQGEYATNGMNGQFVFLYDVERPEGGELKVRLGIHCLHDLDRRRYKVHAFWFLSNNKRPKAAHTKGIRTRKGGFFLKYSIG